MKHAPAGPPRGQRDRELPGEREAKCVRDEDRRQAKLARPLKREDGLRVGAVVREHNGDIALAHVKQRIR